jgi:hypothetical protein
MTTPTRTRSRVRSTVQSSGGVPIRRITCPAVVIVMRGLMHAVVSSGVIKITASPPVVRRSIFSFQHDQRSQHGLSCADGHSQHSSAVQTP